MEGSHDEVSAREGSLKKATELRDKCNGKTTNTSTEQPSDVETTKTTEKHEIVVPLKCGIHNKDGLEITAQNPSDGEVRYESDIRSYLLNFI